MALLQDNDPFGEIVAGALNGRLDSALTDAYVKKHFEAFVRVFDFHRLVIETNVDGFEDVTTLFNNCEELRVGAWSEILQDRFGSRLKVIEPEPKR